MYPASMRVIAEPAQNGAEQSETLMARGLRAVGGVGRERKVRAGFKGAGTGQS